MRLACCITFSAHHEYLALNELYTMPASQSVHTMLSSVMLAEASSVFCVYLAGGVVHCGGELLGVTLGSVVSATITLVSTCRTAAVT